MADTKWHLDRRVPIALIVTLFLQTGSGIWWAATMNARMNDVEEDMISVVADVKLHDDAIANGRENVVVVVEQLRNTNKSVDRLRNEVGQTNDLIRELLMLREN